MPKETQHQWPDIARGMLKSELAKRNVSLKQLAVMLKETYDIDENPTNLSNKISRGTFSAIFMIQCMKVIGCENLRIDD